MKKKCPTCKNWFYKKPSDSKKYWIKRKYCSLKCSGTWYKIGGHYNKGVKRPIGSDSPRYKGGRNIDINGYVRILIPGTGSYQLEHRFIMEKKLGRKLEKWECVHHKNHNRQDNREENFELLIKNEHDRLETKRRWKNYGTLMGNKNIQTGI